MSRLYFVQNITDTAVITGGDAAHIARVLRAVKGDRLTLCDGAGTLFDAEITGLAPARIDLRVLSGRPSEAEPSFCAQMYVGMARGERMDYAVQKSVELGASLIVPFFSARSVVKPGRDGEKAARWGRIAAEAAGQCGRGVLPRVLPPVGFGEMLRMACACPVALFFYEEGGAPLAKALGSPARGAGVAFVTGPEGGFSPEEAAEAEAAGCRPVGLGPRILRCETAPAAALAAAMALTGNLQEGP